MNILPLNKLVKFLEEELKKDIYIRSFEKDSSSNYASWVISNDIFEFYIDGNKMISWFATDNCEYCGLDLELLFACINKKFKIELSMFNLFMFEFNYNEIKEYYKKCPYEAIR